ncbi:MAG TPA: helix-turn-helix transcriptional regulator [Pseudobdellovibrionaceae bacterium]|nr:helix-turn-helix transcriptional regulator [Pseudobdellovibrionaceae bacterium]
MQENLLGAYLRGKRENAELSQGDVAGKLGYSTAQYISNFERGVCQPSLKIISRLAKIYKADMDELFEVIMKQQRIEISKVLFKNKAPKSAKVSGKISVRRR